MISPIFQPKGMAFYTMRDWIPPFYFFSIERGMGMDYRSPSTVAHCIFLMIDGWYNRCKEMISSE
jgi:hypothetical protein